LSLICMFETVAPFLKENNSGFISPEIHILTVQVKLDSWNYPCLSSPYWRLYWNFKGNLWVDFDKKIIPLKNQKRYLIPPDTDFSSHSLGEIDQCYIHFLANSNSSATHVYGNPGIYELRDRPGMGDLFREAAEECLKGKSLSYQSSQLAASLCSLGLADLPVHALMEPIGDPRIRRAANFIRDGINRPMKAKEIAEAAGVSMKSLERHFIRIFDMTPLQYRQKLRIEQACMMLHFSNLTHDEIAEKLGFSDRFHLSKVFTRIRGITPGRYRTMVDELNGT
jgi:AraC-like DNA-binding protein